MAKSQRCRTYGVLALLLVNTSLFFVLFHTFSRDATDRRLVSEPEPLFNSRRRRLLDIRDFRYVLDSDACDDVASDASRKDVTPILVHSHAGHFERRRAVRRSYPRAVLDRLGFRHVFMTGVPDAADVQARLARESRMHGDLVQGSFREAYRNLTYKHVMGLSWFAERCTGATAVCKADDDIAVNLYALSRVVRRLSGTDRLAGCVIRGTPIRDASSKWYVTRDEYAADAYPPFLSGWLYAAGATAVRRLLQVVRPGERHLWIDDLYVTGVLAHRANVTLTDLRPDFETDPGPVHCCVRLRQRCGFLAAPTGDDDALLRPYADRLMRCKAANESCDNFRSSKRHHSCLDLWKKNPVRTSEGRPSIEILN